MDVLSIGKAMPGRDVVVFVSHSGNTSECVAAASQLIRRGITTLALTGRPSMSLYFYVNIVSLYLSSLPLADCKLSKLCMLTLSYNSEGISEPFGCLPTSSVVLQVCNIVYRNVCNAVNVFREHLNTLGALLPIMVST